jgi:hypothetical protein
MNSNVVDHLAPGVTEHVPPRPRHAVDATGTTIGGSGSQAVGRRGHDGKIITVQPLKKDEMQVIVFLYRLFRAVWNFFARRLRFPY